DGVDPRGGGDAEPVEVFGRPSGVGELVEADVIIAVGRQGGVEQGVVVGVVAVAGGAGIDAELPPLCVVQLHGGLHAAVDAQGEAAHDHALPLGAGEDEVIDVGRGADGAVDRRVEGDALGLGDVVVRLLFEDLGQVANDEGA